MIATVGTIQVEAWFTPTIPASVGPDFYHGLPGLILALAVDGGRQTYRAMSILLDSLTEPVVPPTVGRKVSPEEYARLSQERAAVVDRAMRESMEDN